MKTVWQRGEPVPAWYDVIPFRLWFLIPPSWRRRRYRWATVAIGQSYEPSDADIGCMIRCLVLAPNDDLVTTVLETEEQD
jgi:hypothetical protein